ncbi:ORF141 [Staphylococcus phage 92]|uniref:ORF141 n=1 Tax=Staphylococcus phage 92 TaxID=2908151 RepID=Q4ZAI1_9CAUD|nr:ORF141 [Staphylococcus phage 92]
MKVGSNAPIRFVIIDIAVHIYFFHLLNDVVIFVVIPLSNCNFI